MSETLSTPDPGLLSINTATVRQQWRLPDIIGGCAALGACGALGAVGGATGADRGALGAGLGLLGDADGAAGFGHREESPKRAGAARRRTRTPQPPEARPCSTC